MSAFKILVSRRIVNLLRRSAVVRRIRDSQLGALAKQQRRKLDPRKRVAAVIQRGRCEALSSLLHKESRQQTRKHENNMRRQRETQE
jgi:hypothetical protein